METYLFSQREGDGPIVFFSSADQREPRDKKQKESILPNYKKKNMIQKRKRKKKNVKEEKAENIQP